MMRSSSRGISGLSLRAARVLLEPDLVHHRLAARPRRTASAGDHLVEHDAEREDVAAGVELVAEDLLRATCSRRADAGAGLGEVAEALVARDAEVHQLHAALARHHDVGRLDVAVDDAAVVHVVERARDLHRDDGGDVDGQAAALLEQVVEVDALHVLHDDEQRAALLVEVVDVDDVLVLQRRQAPRLALEAGRRTCSSIADRGLERLDRDRAAERVLDGPVDDRHAAGGDLLDDPAVADALEHVPASRIRYGGDGIKSERARQRNPWLDQGSRSAEHTGGLDARGPAKPTGTCLSGRTATDQHEVAAGSARQSV